MRRRLIAGAPLTLIVLAVLVPGGTVAKPAAKVITGKCTAHLRSQTPGKLQGYYYGTVSCASPFGSGLESTTFKETVSATGAVTATGQTKTFYDLGTIHGPYKLTGQQAGTSGTYAATGKIVGGTGAFTHAAGIVKVTCTTSDAGSTLTCHYTSRFTRI